MRHYSISLTLSCHAQTTALARRIAPLLTAGDVLLMDGPIGAGKSFFARSLILALLPQPEDIPSPTFTIVQTYDATAFEIWHCDLYRLSSAFEAQELGLEDAFETALCLVEWPDRLGDLAPKDALYLSLSQTENTDERLITISSNSKRWEKFLEQVND